MHGPGLVCLTRRWPRNEERCNEEDVSQSVGIVLFGPFVFCLRSNFKKKVMLRRRLSVVVRDYGKFLASVQCAQVVICQVNGKHKRQRMVTAGKKQAARHSQAAQHDAAGALR